MKKAILTIIMAMVAMPVCAAVEKNPAIVLPSGATVVVPNVAIQKAPPLELIQIVHYKKGFAKPEKPGKPPKNPKEVTCYSFISGLAKLIDTEDVLINPLNSEMVEVEVLNTINTSMQTWDNETNTSLFGDLITDYTANFDTYADGVNEISFGNYPQTGVIAVTRIWGKFSGRPNTRYITQFDILFDTDYKWGNADLNSALMDLQNIATHELGHTVGLNDTYADSCSEVTMYGYSNNGETKKRTLEEPDITGLRKLYNN